MAVLTFSRTFPTYMPNAGEPTFFVEKILNSLDIEYRDDMDYKHGLIEWNKKSISEGKLNTGKLIKFWADLNDHITDRKIHTIRNGNRRKEGDIIKPRVWSGKPYNSPQIQFAPDIPCVRTFDFETLYCGSMYIDGNAYGGWSPLNPKVAEVAKNDGLTGLELIQWLGEKKDFTGQIISWHDINY